MDSTEYVFPNGTVSSGPNLPTNRHGHCLVKLNDGKIMIIGGSGRAGYKSVIIFDPVMKSFTNGPSLKYDFYYGACILMESAMHGNRHVVLAAGGNGYITAQVCDYTQSQAWQESKNFCLSAIARSMDFGTNCTYFLLF